MTEAEKIAAVEAELRASLPGESEENIRYSAKRLVEIGMPDSTRAGLLRVTRKAMLKAAQDSGRLVIIKA